MAEWLKAIYWVPLLYTLPHDSYNFSFMITNTGCWIIKKNNAFVLGKNYKGIEWAK